MESTPTLRYNISERLDAKPRQEALRIRASIMRNHDKVASTWHDWLKLTLKDSRDIPAVVLRDIAVLLKVPMESLFNNQ